MNRYTPIAGLLIISMLGVTSPVIADEAAMNLLNRMKNAMHELSYKGTLAYMRGSSVQTLQINHTVVNGIENESVVRVNGAGSEVSRELKGFSLASIPKISPIMKQVYSFDVGRTNRIAKLPCVIITARPKDRARYLQKYCIHTKTAMLLDYVLVDKSHKPVERFMFTAINIVSSNNVLQRESAGALANKVKKSKVIAGRANNSSQNINRLTPPNLDDGWVIDKLPKGYNIRRAPNIRSGQNKKGRLHYILSDGLSSLSVFLSTGTKNGIADNVFVNSGALNVLRQKKQNHMITVVGEVPVSTLKSVIRYIHRK